MLVGGWFLSVKYRLCLRENDVDSPLTREDKRFPDDCSGFLEDVFWKRDGIVVIRGISSELLEKFNP